MLLRNSNLTVQSGRSMILKPFSARALCTTKLQVSQGRVSLLQFCYKGQYQAGWRLPAINPPSSVFRVSLPSRPAGRRPLWSCLSHHPVAAGGPPAIRPPSQLTSAAVRALDARPASESRFKGGPRAAPFPAPAPFRGFDSDRSRSARRCASTQRARRLRP